MAVPVNRRLASSTSHFLAAGADKERVRKIQAVRLIVAAAAEKETRLTRTAIARRIGLTEREVDEVMSSPEFRDLVSDAALERVTLTLHKGLQRLDDIIDDDGQKPDIHLKAVRAATQLYKTLVDASPRHQSEDAKDLMGKFLESLPAAKFNVSSQKESDASSG